MTRIALNHLVGRFETGIGDFGNGQLFVVGLFSRDDGSVCDQGEMDTWVGHQVSLEFSQINIELVRMATESFVFAA